MMWIVAFLALLLPGSASAEQVVAALSQNRVALTTDFDGSELLIYGAIKREMPEPSAPPLDIVVAVTGPERAMILRKKERRFGIWVTAENREIQAAPSFYAVATTGPLAKILPLEDRARYGIGADQVVRIADSDRTAIPMKDSRAAVVRLQRKEGLFFEQTGGVTVQDNTLFQTRVPLPPKLVEGQYRARILLLRGGEVIDMVNSPIDVQRVGIMRWIYTMAQEQSTLYGIASIAIALIVGWASSAFFRYILP